MNQIALLSLAGALPNLRGTFLSGASSITTSPRAFQTFSGSCLWNPETLLEPAVE